MDNEVQLPTRKPLVDVEFLKEVEEVAGFQPWPNLKMALERMEQKRERCKRSRLWRLFYWIQSLG